MYYCFPFNHKCRTHETSNFYTGIIDQVIINRLFVQTQFNILHLQYYGWISITLVIKWNLEFFDYLKPLKYTIIQALLYSSILSQQNVISFPRTTLCTETRPGGV